MSGDGNVVHLGVYPDIGTKLAAPQETTSGRLHTTHEGRFARQWDVQENRLLQHGAISTISRLNQAQNASMEGSNFIVPL